MVATTNPDKRLKVLFLPSWYPTEEQPAQGVFIREHAKAVQLYDEVVVLHCAGSKSGLKRAWWMEQETDEDLTEGLPTYRVWSRRSLIPKIWYFFYLWSVWRAFQRIVAQGFLPDIIHAHVYTAGVPAVLIGKLYHIPVVITEHSTEFPRKLLRGSSVWRARLAFRWADMVMPVSGSLKTAIEDYGIRAQFRLIPNVVDINLFHPGPSLQARNQLKHLLVVSLLDSSHKKGIPHLLQAMAELRGQREDWQLDIVGDGPAREEYEQMTTDMEIANKVTFHGLKSKSEVAKFMRRADIFILPSLWENLPCVLLESMASALPMISTRTGGTPEIVNDEVGILVPPGDAEQLSRAIAQMLESLDKFDRRAISQKARRYSPESVGRQIHNIYKDHIR